MSDRTESEKDIYTLYQESLVLVHKNKYEEARASLLAIKESFPRDLEIVSRVNDLLKVCERHLSPATFEPVTGANRIDRGVMLHNLGRYEEALECFKEALAGAGRHDLAHVHYAMAASYAAQGNTDKAIQTLKKGIELLGEMRFMARNDPDFEKLLENADFRQLVKPAEK